MESLLRIGLFIQENWTCQLVTFLTNKRQRFKEKIQTIKPQEKSLLHLFRFMKKLRSGKIQSKV